MGQSAPNIVHVIIVLLDGILWHKMMKVACRWFCTPRLLALPPHCNQADVCVVSVPTFPQEVAKLIKWNKTAYPQAFQPCHIPPCRAAGKAFRMGSMKSIVLSPKGPQPWTFCQTLNQ
ncbi:hypothetical protein M404DRAFT_850433 [Pisolithus tinctorius Marx 270]|uniref:Uncharacterized protein n=1 Tax=Pisolithus tinctorius Marx 270 TaxID=870435 RepID=A0A0C3NBT0_PISTI|nr:hypothetical protein M404DRAFT_850433 [Pisolithus tinctorius Marx 270]